MPSVGGMVHFLRAAAAAGLTLLMTGCHSPSPRPWLRYELDGPTELQSLGGGRFEGVVNGAGVRVNLSDQQTRVYVTVENDTGAPVSVSVGPDAGAPSAVIGEVLLRQLDGPAAGGPKMASYSAMSPLELGSGWRAMFYLDSPLGREIKLGQYFVFAVEVGGADDTRQRVHLPVVGKLGSAQR
jgi:hypothetical protein